MMIQQNTNGMACENLENIGYSYRYASVQKKLDFFPLPNGSFC